MPKISIGGSHDSSTTKVHVEHSKSSTLELKIGDSYDMSVREISIIEHKASKIGSEVQRLQTLIKELERSNDKSIESKKLAQEASSIANVATKIIKERRWYSVSASGLMDAAKAVGSVTTPLVASALKIVELLKGLKE